LNEQSQLANKVGSVTSYLSQLESLVRAREQTYQTEAKSTNLKAQILITARHKKNSELSEHLFSLLNSEEQLAQLEYNEAKARTT